MTSANSKMMALLRTIMPRGIRKKFVHLGFHLAPEEFEMFSHLYCFAPSMRFSLRSFADRGFQPAIIIDVGAFEGQWSQMAHEIWPEAKILMVEPNFLKQEELSKIVETIGGRLYCELLGAEDGREVSFAVMGTGSSVFEERSDLVRTKETRTLRRLDTLLGDINIQTLLKVDAQGYELEILKGAAGILGSTDAILLEVSTIEINIGAPILHEVCEFMHSAGFVAYDVLGIHRRPLDGALNQLDILFLRKSSVYLVDKRHA